MNEHAPRTELSPHVAREAHLQALDLGSLGIANASDEPLVCDIDDPDCELPEGMPATTIGAADIAPPRDQT